MTSGQLTPFTMPTDKWRDAAALLTVALLCALALYTRRAEVVLLLGAPMALLMVTKFRFAVTITTWVTLMWVSRIPAVFLGLNTFSYLVYLCFVLTTVAYLVRAASPTGRSLPVVKDPWIWLFIATIVAGGVHGAMQVDGIPSWVLTPENADYSSRWVYLRTVMLPGVLLPGLAIAIAVSIQDGQKLEAILAPVCAFVWTINLFIVGAIATSGTSLTVLAAQRGEHLVKLGFHSNEFGTLLAVAYALLLGTREGVRDRRSRAILGVTLWATALALVLTFSRGAYVAFLATNALYFLRASPGKKMVAVAGAAFVVLFAPSILIDRIQYGFDGGDLNAISAGRLDGIWAPLLPDIGANLLFGQGLHSIMWTDAQRFQQIFPVSIAHNAYLDLILDLGALGAVTILGWYIHLWRRFGRFSIADGDPAFRAFFFGGHLALVALFLCALVNDRLTPTSPSVCLWIASGVILGRTQMRSQAQPERALTGRRLRAGMTAPKWDSRPAARQIA
jgi:O-antigen ligase